MTELTTEQLIYLLYAKAYAKATEADTITRGDIKSYLPDEYKEKAEKIYGDLKKEGLIQLKTKDGKTTDNKGNSLTRDGRFCVTDKGEQVLIDNLKTTDYDFTSFKSYKILSTVLTYLFPYIKELAKVHPQTKLSEKMTFEKFREKFKELYSQERKQQSLKGVVAIRRRKISRKFIEENFMLQQEFDQYFEELRKKGEISTTEGREDELIEWVE